MQMLALILSHPPTAANATSALHNAEREQRNMTQHVLSAPSTLEMDSRHHYVMLAVRFEILRSQIDWAD